MNQFFKINLFLSFTLLVFACNSKKKTTQTTNNTTTETVVIAEPQYLLLNPQNFNSKLNSMPNSQIVDVRTAQEYEKGRIKNSLNFDIYSTKFDSMLNTLDKSKPVFVYCLSGGRSQDAVKKMQKLGFMEIYELKGGFISWRAEQLPEEGNKTVVVSDTKKTDPNILNKRKNLTKAEFYKIIESHDLVLVDFYAVWCGPCKRLKPTLDEIKKEMGDKLLLLTIDVDENQSLSSQLGITAMPTMHVYKKQKLTWNNEGLVNKKTIQTQLD